MRTLSRILVTVEVVPEPVLNYCPVELILLRVADRRMACLDHRQFRPHVTLSTTRGTA
jgi:hypothetical protein